MAFFASLFPEVAVAETLRLRAKDRPGLPDGDYLVYEYYCNEPGCGCRRVILQITKPPSETILATISAGLESVKFYRARAGRFMEPAEWKGPSLDPLNPQSEYAPALLEMIRGALAAPEILEILERHCHLFENHAGSRKPKRVLLRPSASRRRRG